MEFKVELNNMDYTDPNLIRALENISDSIKYKVVMSIEEISDAIEHYFLEELEINLEASNMRLDIVEGKLYYDNVFEAAIIIDQLSIHFGNGSVGIGGSGEEQDYYCISPMILIRKIAKFALIQAYADDIVLYFDQANEFTQTWIYKYLKEIKED